MPNTIEWTEQNEKLEVASKLQHLVEFLDSKDTWDNPTKYTILEYFPTAKDNPLTYIPNVYNLYNLTMEIHDDGIVYCVDLERYLEDKMYANTPLPLQALIIDDILHISFQEDENKVTISMAYGYVQIYY